METRKDNTIPLKITLFASFQVKLNGRSLTNFATDKVRALLVYLLVERQQSHHREKLADLLWPDQPQKRSRQNLRQALSNLRQTLADSNDLATPLLLIDRHKIQVNPQADVWLDVAEFETFAETCHHHHHRQISACLPCLGRLEAMLALYSGDFLAGFSLTDSILFEEWVLLKREWWHRQAAEALIHLADYYERRGDYPLARRYTQQMLHIEPWREESHRQLMRLLFYEGQRSAALTQYETCQRVLAQELDISPTAETINLYKAIRDKELWLEAGKKRPFLGSMATAATPFVGRTTELAELAEMLADPDCRLITLVGPGGIGKTRLAMQVAEAHVGLYADGVYWVGLSAIAAADLIMPTIAQGIGFVPYGKEPLEKQLFAYLREKRLLLILDNMEHLATMPDVTAALLQHAPYLSLLTTSRERLALREEWLYALDGLAVMAEASQLFMQTVQRSHRKFTPTAVDEIAMVEICHLVEGMPLALELAAAWIPERDCAAIARELASDIDLLISSLHNVPERQRSMQATFEYSWVMLTDAERLMFARLAVFRGGFTATAAAQVAEVDRIGLARLAAKSLVRAGKSIVNDQNGNTSFVPYQNSRYQLHELLRQFAAHKLAAFPGEEKMMSARHAAHYLTFLAGQEIALKGTGQEQALAAIDREIDNVRQAWEWAVTALGQGQETAIDLLSSALESYYLFYGLHSWYQEGAAIFARAVTAFQSGSNTPFSPANPRHLLLRGELLARQAHFLEFTAPPEQAIALYQESLACFRAIDAEQETALPLYGLGYMAHIQSDYETARRYFEESLGQYQAADNRWGMANVQSSLCLTLRRQGAFAEAAEAGRQSLAIRRHIGDRRGIASSQNNLGLIYCALGDYDAAAEALQESTNICREIGHTVGVANALTSLCQLFANAKAPDRAMEVQREAKSLFQEAGDLWGIAVAYNNLGQLALEASQPEQAQLLLEKSVQIYRELGIQSGLAHGLNNLGKTSYALGEMSTAGRHFHEALVVAVEIGDRPIALELLTRIAVLIAAQTDNGRSLVMMAFALQQSELFAETHKTAVKQFTIMKDKFSVESVTSAEDEAHHLDFDTVTAEALTLLQQIRFGVNT